MDDDLMTVEQAATAYDVSMLTLRRRAQYGEIEGAVKVRGRRGPEWRVPVAAMEALGYERRPSEVPDLASLVATVARLSESLAVVQKENARLNRELGAAVAEAARLNRRHDASGRIRELQPREAHVLDLRDPGREVTQGSP